MNRTTQTNMLKSKVIVGKALRSIVRNTRASQAIIVKCSRLQSPLDQLYANLIEGYSKTHGFLDEKTWLKHRLDYQFLSLAHKAIRKGHQKIHYQNLPECILKRIWSSKGFNSGCMFWIGEFKEELVFCGVATTDHHHISCAGEIPYILNQVSKISKFANL